MRAPVMSDSSLLAIMGVMTTGDATARIRVNGLEVGPDGEFVPAPAARPLLRFLWRGRVCEAALISSGLRFSVALGRAPSTAIAPERRHAVLDAARAMASRLPEGWRCRLAPDHTLLLDALAHRSASMSVVGLLAGLVKFALALDPVCDEMDTAGLELITEAPAGA